MKKKETFIKNYINFELLKGRAPNSIYEFCKEYKTNEANFYEHFNSFSQLRKHILADFINNTIKTLDNDKDYEEFTSKEKVLALFFTLFEEFKNSRSYLINRYDETSNYRNISSDWELFFLQFNARIEQILQEGKMADEIKERKFIGDHYSKGYKLVFAYVFRVWIKDESKGFETTDAAIEKSINLSYDMLGNGPLDALIDFGRFALKTKVM